MFENFIIKRLQEKIIQRGKHEEQINKAIEELKELIQELQLFKLEHSPFVISDSDLKKPLGNMQKEIRDVENIICKLKLMFVKTSAQRFQYDIAGGNIINSLEEYLRRG